MDPLPIDPALPALRDALLGGPAVLLAPPGSGKTTRVPLALLGERWLAGRRIVLLEPRRLAARAAAGWMARLLGEPVGARVGYRIRRDTRVGPATRIEVVTEGVLTRMLAADPGLAGVGLVIFDEFHERSLHGDLGLALTLHSRTVLREDLRVLVMSATLDGAPVARLLGGAPIVTAEGRAFPVGTRYAAPRPGARVDAAVAGAVRDALARETGDILVFLPGAAEIRRTVERLADPPLPAGIRVHPLYGDLPPEAQEAAIAPSPAGGRKVVLATSIAETSLTIEGVRVVIDSGLARVPRFSPRSGMARLETVRVSRASADQRRGRAGRIAPGVCWRLWAEAAAAELRPFDTPEILEADLAPLALELADAGVTDPAELRWLDPPPAAALAQARELLAELGALDTAGRITPHGRAVAELALHPRLAHMLIRARVLNMAGLACDLVALLGERDILRGVDDQADITLRLEALRRGDPRASPSGLRRARAEAALLRRRLGVRAERGEPAAPAAGLLLALAYPDRIGQRRPARRAGSCCEPASERTSPRPIRWDLRTTWWPRSSTAGRGRAGSSWPRRSRARISSVSWATRSSPRASSPGTTPRTPSSRGGASGLARSSSPTRRCAIRIPARSRRRSWAEWPATASARFPGAQARSGSDPGFASFTGSIRAGPTCRTRRSRVRSPNGSGRH
jgi:ATP-dependent helicase HrpB